MTTQDIMKSAKQGNTQAIASLINQTLQQKGMIATVTKKGVQLNIKVQSKNVPDQNSVMKFLKGGLQKLIPTGISQVQVQAIGSEADPYWEESFSIAGANVSQSSSNNHKQINKSKSHTSKVSVNAKVDDSLLDSVICFFKSRNGERVAISAATFIATSGLWLISILAVNNLSRFFTVASPQADQVEVPEAVADDQLSSSSSEEEAQNIEAIEEVVEEPESEPGEAFLTQYLDDITTSDLSGIGHWCAETESSASSLFSPRSYEILSFFSSEEIGRATARIESSNKGGMPIVKTWNFYIKRGPTVNESRLRENGNAGAADQVNQKNENWCLSMLVE